MEWKKKMEKKFVSVSEEWKEIIKKNKIDLTNSVILHLRRGDYLNVATHLISCEEILKCVISFQVFSEYYYLF